MTDYALRAKEYAKMERELRAILIEQTEKSVQLIFSRNAAAQARDNFREALNTELLSDGAYAAKEVARELFSLITLFFLVGSCILLLPIWATFDLRMDTTSMVVCWLLLMLVIRILFILTRLNTSGELAYYRRFRSYMEKNRATVQKQWEEKRKEVDALNAKLADPECCNISAEYQNVAANLLYYIKSEGASSIQEAIRSYKADVASGEAMRKLDWIAQQVQNIQESVNETQRNQSVLEGLMVYHTFFQHR